MAKQMWDNLISVHKMHGQQSITALCRTLYHTKAVEGDNITVHMNTMCSYQATLHQMGSKVNDEGMPLQPRISALKPGMQS